MKSSSLITRPWLLSRRVVRTLSVLTTVLTESSDCQDDFPILQDVLSGLFQSCQDDFNVVKTISPNAVRHLSDDFGVVRTILVVWNDTNKPLKNRLENISWRVVLKTRTENTSWQHFENVCFVFKIWIYRLDSTSWRTSWKTVLIMSTENASWKHVLISFCKYIFCFKKYEFTVLTIRPEGTSWQYILTTNWK